MARVELLAYDSVADIRLFINNIVSWWCHPFWWCHSVR